MDAREKWMTQLAELCFAFYDTYQSGLSERAAALDAIQAHARTTPEGFALVPVPEWVPFDEFTSYPAPESSGWFWYIKDDEIFRGTAMQVCLARGVTYWCPADNPPAPPKAAPPKSEPL